MNIEQGIVMCLAIPMRVIEVRGEADDFLSSQIGVVEAEGIEKEVRLDMVDRWPEVGDYLIIHAGFAIKKLDEEAAMETIRLLKEAADFVDNLDSDNG